MVLLRMASAICSVARVGRREAQIVSLCFVFKTVCVAIAAVTCDLSEVRLLAQACHNSIGEEHDLALQLDYKWSLVLSAATLATPI
eukprot:5052777-Amphidinium_carterae.1